MFSIDNIETVNFYEEKNIDSNAAELVALLHDLQEKKEILNSLIYRLETSFSTNICSTVK